MDVVPYTGSELHDTAVPITIRVYAELVPSTFPAIPPKRRGNKFKKAPCVLLYVAPRQEPKGRGSRLRLLSSDRFALRGRPEARYEPISTRRDGITKV
ncbi:hypothetical protein K440DRAFT_617556 [Wilcoxina mikolae CBS 423.85]|nr:hypothetical protein K440DRAFT_617556 [Wilcoxina mikolae CBS 423.85]